MKINTKYFSFKLALILLSSSFLDKYMFFAILLLMLCYLMIKHRKFIRFDMPGKYFYICVLLIGLFVGILNFLSNQNSLYVLFKQFYYAIFPYIFWCIGKGISSEKKFCLDRYIHTLFIVCLVLCLKTAYMYMNAYIDLGGFADIRTWRLETTTGNSYSIIMLALIFLFRKNIHFNKIIVYIGLGLSIVCILFSFSRTLIIDILLLIVIYGWSASASKKAKILGSIVVFSIIIILIAPDQILSLLSKFGSVFNEMSSKHTWDNTTINHNWRGYEIYCVLKQLESGSLFNRVFGFGYGRMLDVGAYAYLVTDEEGLSLLHNGYMYVFFLQGLVGLASYICWLIKIYKAKINFKALNVRLFYSWIISMVILHSYVVGGVLLGSSTLLLHLSILWTLEKECFH